jgi:hypothetical protein
VKEALQVVPQSIPEGLDVTVPLPLVFTESENVCGGVAVFGVEGVLAPTPPHPASRPSKINVRDRRTTCQYPGVAMSKRPFFFKDHRNKE